MKAYEIKLWKEVLHPIEAMKIASSKDAELYARKFYSDDIGIYESMFVILLNRAGETIGYAKLSQGGTCSTLFDVKILAKIAIDSMASAVILVHNHPSGCLQPSRQDKELTRKAKSALELFDILLFDHIVLSETDYFSFNDSGML